jgi:hypothetical protein
LRPDAARSSSVHRSDLSSGEPDGPGDVDRVQPVPGHAPQSGRRRSAREGTRRGVEHRGEHALVIRPRRPRNAQHAGGDLLEAVAGDRVAYGGPRHARRPRLRDEDEAVLPLAQVV